MNKSRTKLLAPAKRVWRITVASPMGEWVTLDGTEERKPAAASTKPVGGLPEVSYGSWVTSSYDLLDGTDVTEDPDTVPGDLFDELFAPRPEAKKPPGA